MICCSEVFLLFCPDKSIIVGSFEVGTLGGESKSIKLSSRSKNNY